MRSTVKRVAHFVREVQATVISVTLLAALSRRVTLPVAKGDCVVLGNGPSLRKDIESNPGILQGRQLLCVNDFARSDSFAQWRPDYYVLLDPYYWAEDLSDTQIDERRQFFECLSTKTQWPLVLFVPHQCRRSGTWNSWRFSQHPQIKICYFNRTPVEGFTWFQNWAFSHDLGMPWAQNVLVAAIFLALRIGYRTIYLLGADHSWHESLLVGPDSQVYLTQKHFYDEGQAKPQLVYKTGTEHFTMHELFFAFGKVFRGYTLLAAYARELGARIYNASSKTYVDAFPRLDHTSIPPGTPSKEI